VLTESVPLVAAALLPAGVPLRRAWWLLGVAAAPLVGWPLALVPDRAVDWVVALGDPVVAWALLAAAVGVALLARRRARGPVELAVAVLALATLPGLAGRWPYDLASYHAVVVLASVAAAGTTLVLGAVGLRSMRTLPADRAAEQS
jgi:hypothetical protein